jgi:uncharacterized iron-regulated protein
VVANDVDDTTQPLPLKNQEHSLAERIYAIHQGAFVSEQRLLKAIEQHQFVLLGETHDNQRHHDLQQQLIEHLADRFPPTSVAFEMINNEQAATLGDLNQYDIDSLIKRLSDSGDGWNYQANYRALLATSLNNDLAIHPANIDKNKLMSLMQNETGEIDPKTQAWLIQMPLDADLENRLRQENVDSHCGMFTADDATPMVRVQRARDVVMAQSLFTSKAEKRVLIAGLGHVREDRGVPFYLTQQVPVSSVLTIGFIEVDPEKMTPEQYMASWDQARFPFDYVWFTASADREDPCLAFQTGQS